jgi:hypothetical protein
MPQRKVGAMPYLSIGVAVVVGRGRHRVQAQRRRVRGLEVEVAGQSQVAAGAEVVETSLTFVGSGRLLTWLTTPPVEPRPNSIDAEPRSTSIAVEVEDVALVERGVADAVDEDVAAGGEREAAQADVLLAALGRLEADAGGVVQRLLHGVGAAVLHQLLGDHGDRLRDVAQILVAAADRAGRRPHRVLVGLGLGLDRDRCSTVPSLAGAPARSAPSARGAEAGARRAGAAERATWASAATLNSRSRRRGRRAAAALGRRRGRGSEVTSG